MNQRRQSIIVERMIRKFNIEIAVSFVFENRTIDAEQMELKSFE